MVADSANLYVMPDSPVERLRNEIEREMDMMTAVATGGRFEYSFERGAET